MSDTEAVGPRGVRRRGREKMGDEDISKIRDPAHRRRIQVRMAQRAYRQRQKDATRAQDDLDNQSLIKCSRSAWGMNGEVQGAALWFNIEPVWGGVGLIRDRRTGSIHDRTLEVTRPPTLHESLGRGFKPKRIEINGDSHFDGNQRPFGSDDHEIYVLDNSDGNGEAVVAMVEEQGCIGNSYWSGLADIFAKSMGEIPFIVDSISDTSPLLSESDETAPYEREWSEGTDVADIFPRIEELGSIDALSDDSDEEDAHVTTQDWVDVWFQTSRSSFTGHTNTEQSFRQLLHPRRIDNTFETIWMDSQSAFGAALDVGDIMNLPLRFFNTCERRAISPLFRWRERLDAMPRSYHPAIPDPIAPSDDMGDLKPMPIQVQKIHHFWVDLIPWPNVRVAILHSLDTLIDEIDEFELVYDYLNGGCRHWGGAPWLGRNFEVSENFYLKWGFLLDNYAKDSTDYWRKKRGLESIRRFGGVGTIGMAGRPGRRKLVVERPEVWGIASSPGTDENYCF